MTTEAECVGFLGRMQSADVQDSQVIQKGRDGGGETLNSTGV